MYHVGYSGSPAYSPIYITLDLTMWKPASVAFVLGTAVLEVMAAPCVKVRDGTDGLGPSGGYRCIQFDERSRRAAAKFRLTLASPYEAVRTRMESNGWRIDEKWLEDWREDAERGLPVCGQGWDAICHIQMKKGTVAVVLTFSGTNEGRPLIAVDPTK